MRGLLLSLFLLLAAPAFAVQVKVAEAPINDLALTVQAIATAKQSVLMNIYDLSSQDVAAAIIDRVKAGVHVEVLEEGQPVGGLPYAGREIIAQISQAMAAANTGDHFFVMTSKPLGSKGQSAENVKRRYRFDHAKYIVVDGESLLIGSENYSPTGNPAPGAVGNRGWEVFIRDSDLANTFTQVFRGDANPDEADVVDAVDEAKKYSLEKPVKIGDINKLKQLARQMPIFEADAVKPIFSPDTSLKGLVALLNSAETSIDIQQMSFDSDWGKDGGQSPLLKAVIAAARRGVKVRVLLNDESVFDKPGRKSNHKNPVTVDILNKLASDEGLKVEGRIADVKAMGVDYIHNKGMLIDGHITLISSINWGENAVEHNRESAVAIDSSDVFSHYEQLFSTDWDASAE